MSVHKDLILHAEKQNKLYREFALLDEQREAYIEEAVELCKAGKEFTTDRINEVTEQINVLANHRLIPTRKVVTPDMVREYVERLQ
ncbi:DUF2533 family protein [Bacillus sp. FJAT-42315]|uniref:DUF2533 family protein n=1 Tax=Bacillus sp. FJAT-42315 TaxID=2014077 RepID=UPI000C2481D8|nr:DUF2533 family protein [Bacillus sp. FJAT-42315]